MLARRQQSAGQHGRDEPVPVGTDSNSKVPGYFGLWVNVC